MADYVAMLPTFFYRKMAKKVIEKAKMDILYSEKAYVDQELDAQLINTRNISSIGNASLGSWKKPWPKTYQMKKAAQVFNSDQEIEEEKLGLEFINKLHPVSVTTLDNKITHTINYKKDKKIISLHSPHDELLAQSPGGHQYGVKQDELIAPMIKAIQEQQAQIEALTAEIQALKNS